MKGRARERVGWLHSPFLLSPHPGGGSEGLQTNPLPRVIPSLRERYGREKPADRETGRFRKQTKLQYVLVCLSLATGQKRKATKSKEDTAGRLENQRSQTNRGNVLSWRIHEGRAGILSTEAAGSGSSKRRRVARRQCTGGIIRELGGMFEGKQFGGVFQSRAISKQPLPGPARGRMSREIIDLRQASPVQLHRNNIFCISVGKTTLGFRSPPVHHPILPTPCPPVRPDGFFRATRQD